MNMPFPAPSAPAGGQTLRLPGGSRDAVLHDQLYRYAEDLQHMIDRHGALESRCETLRESCDRLAASRATLDELIRCSRDIHIVTDTKGIILQCNPAVAIIALPQHLAGHDLGDWVLPTHRTNLLALRDLALENGSSAQEEWELHFRRDSHDPSPVIVSAQVLTLPHEGSPHTLHWILRDITHQREVEFETQISSMVFKSAAEGVMITDIEGGILAVNPAFTSITGYSATEVLGRNPRFLKSGIQDGAFYAELWRSLREKGSWQGEVYNRKKNGEIYPEWLTISAARDNAGRVLSYIAVFSDLSRLLRAEKRLSYLAHHDTLTGLPNRLLFQDRISQTLAQARRSGTPFTVIFIDLDRFKEINDTLGHEVGDQVLKEVGKRLVAAMREIDTVARLGGDEFVILAPTLSGNEHIAAVCIKAIGAISRPIQIGNHVLSIGGSFGCAGYPDHGENETTLLKHADTAMYRAKAAGGNAYAVHTSPLVTGATSPAS